MESASIKIKRREEKRLTVPNKRLMIRGGFRNSGVILDLPTRALKMPRGAEDPPVQPSNKPALTPRSTFPTILVAKRR